MSPAIKVIDAPVKLLRNHVNGLNHPRRVVALALRFLVVQDHVPEDRPSGAQRNQASVFEGFERYLPNASVICRHVNRIDFLGSV